MQKRCSRLYVYRHIYISQHIFKGWGITQSCDCQSDFLTISSIPGTVPLEYKDLFNPENNQKSASIFTNEKKWTLKTLSNLSKDTISKWLGQDFNPGGLVSKAWALSSTGWESRAHNGPLGKCSVTHYKLFLPRTWGGFCIESNILQCARWRHISLTGKLTRNASLFLLNSWMGPRNRNFNTLSRW